MWKNYYKNIADLSYSSYCNFRISLVVPGPAYSVAVLGSNIISYHFSYVQGIFLLLFFGKLHIRHFLIFCLPHCPCPPFPRVFAIIQNSKFSFSFFFLIPPSTYYTVHFPLYPFLNPFLGGIPVYSGISAGFLVCLLTHVFAWVFLKEISVIYYA